MRRSGWSRHGHGTRSPVALWHASHSLTRVAFVCAVSCLFSCLLEFGHSATIPIALRLQQLTKYGIDTHNIVINQMMTLKAGRNSDCGMCQARLRMQQKYIDQVPLHPTPPPTHPRRVSAHELVCMRVRLHTVTRVDRVMPVLTLVRDGIAPSAIADQP